MVVVVVVEGGEKGERNREEKKEEKKKKKKKKKKRDPPPKKTPTKKTQKKKLTWLSQTLSASCGLSTLSMMALVASRSTCTSRAGPAGGIAPIRSPRASASAAAAAAACAMPLPSPRGSNESSAPIERSKPTTEMTSIDSRRSMLSTLTGAGCRAGAPDASARTSRMSWSLSQQPEMTSKAERIEAIEKALATPLRTAFQWPLVWPVSTLVPPRNSSRKE